jgi:hypothetical protein
MGRSIQGTGLGRARRGWAGRGAAGRGKEHGKARNMARVWSRNLFRDQGVNGDDFKCNHTSNF